MSSEPQHTPGADRPIPGHSADAEPHFRRLLDALPAAAYTCDADGLITHYNRHAEALWGRAPALHDPVDRFCGSFRLFAPDGTPLPHAECWMALALRTGQEYSEEIVIERPDGERRTALANASPIHDQAGRVVGAVNLLIDISDRVGSDEASARLAAIVESSDDAIISKTLDGEILSWNAGAERLFGYTAAEAIGQPITMLIPADMRDEERVILARLRRGERVAHYETIRVAKDGRRLTISLTSSPVRDRTGRIVGASKVARDITARKQAEAAMGQMIRQLRDADRFRNEFLATLAHELRNPMAPIGNAVQILRQIAADTSPETRWAVDIVDHQLGQLTRLVDDLLDVARITNNKLQLRKERIDLAEAIRLAVETSRPHIDAAAHELVLAISPDPLYVDGDVTRLAQVMANLLNNAARYSEPGGRIWLRATREGGEVVVSVRDTGIGIAREMQAGIFEMFTQGQRPADQAHGGLGIGLTLVDRLVTMHGGTVAVASDGPGRGSEFTVRLPVAGATGPRATPDAAPTRAAVASRRVLIVDDNHEAADSLCILLSMAGHETHVAYDGLQAVARAAELRPEIVLLDVGLPKLDGYDVAREIRRQPGGDRIVLIALTGWGHESAVQRSMAAGFDRHLVKPVHPTILAQLLATAHRTDRGAPPPRSA